MKYNLKTSNYKDFDVFKDNSLKARSYFIPYESREKLLETSITNERYSSDMVAVLSGDWNFKYFEKLSELPDEIDSNSFNFDKVTVPSTWQHTGYEKPYYVNTRYQFTPNPPEIPEDCPVAIYLKRFEIEKNTNDFVLTFLGVAGSLDLFVNGKYVGYSEGSHNTCEFDITSKLIDGVNEIIVVNHKWCNGTYLECQDMFRDNGIFRDVLLTKTTKNKINDIHSKVSFYNDGVYGLDVAVNVSNRDECSLQVELFDNKKLIAKKDSIVNMINNATFSFRELDVKEWSSETPNLYDLIITLKLDDKDIEVVRKRIGFNHIEIRENVFYFNNQRIKLLGVNHHDTDAKKGFAMSVDDMERDVKTFKEYNVNCVRTSHYPPDPTFLDLCDEYGIYVVDEADIETHGVGELKRPNLISNNLKWKEHYWHRVESMFERDKNHPSIVMWSLGNESGGIKCQDYCFENIKKLTPIPIHYEGASRTTRFSYDVISQMYPWHNRVKKIADGHGLSEKYYKKPYFMCEYAHAMGVGAGDLEKYVLDIYRANNMLGGCIWEFADHAIYNENSKYKYTYGGDNGEWRHDKNFCVDGLFFPDRKPHTGALQMKTCYRPVRVSTNNKIDFDFKNYYCFKTAEFDVQYSVLSDGTEVKTGNLKLSIPAGRTQSVTIKTNLHNSCHNVIIFTYLDNEFEIAKEQIVLNEGQVNPNFESKSAPKVSESQTKSIITFDKGKIVYNDKTGFIESYVYQGVEMLNRHPLNSYFGIGTEVYRAPLDNDMYMNLVWTRSGIDNVYQSKSSGKKCVVNENTVVIENEMKLSSVKGKNIGKVQMKYVISGNGSIKVTMICKSVNSKFVPRFGASFEMPKEFSNIEYYGLNKESLSDYKEHAVFEIVETKVSEMHQKYIKPQESGMRYNTLWARVTNADGFGLSFEAVEKPFIFNANHYNVAQCAKALHAEDLIEYDTTNIHIDGYMMGAGSNSCGPVPTKENRKFSVKDIGFTFIIKPTGNK